jgi:RNA polymerase sigma-70 factor, ECF subfamily
MDDCNIFEIWEEYKSSLFGYIKKRVTEEDDAKDILQDVLLKSYQYCSNGKSVLYLKSWLYKITQNTIIDYHKKNNKTISFSLDYVETANEKSIIGEASDHFICLTLMV